ncbi:hypothetical protein HanIR_Chr12g0612341 [Helianthus annuus]|nr:hypothetical protein HanIR_Chr12g0612341 [Helianthus annuus]
MTLSRGFLRDNKWGRCKGIWKIHNYPHVLIMCHKLTESFNQVEWKGQNL